MNYIFDVDGTLTGHRKKIDPEFAKFFSSWIKGRSVYIASGSTYPMIKEQLGDILNKVSGVFTCQGNEFHIKSKPIYKIIWESKDVEKYLEQILKKSKWQDKTGKHIDVRSGMINFTTLGRNSVEKQRQQYVQWDKIHQERFSIINLLNLKFPYIRCSLGGEISIDLALPGFDKGQIRSRIIGPILFFADSARPGGNDYSLFKNLESYNDIMYHVIDYFETWQQLSRSNFK